MKTVKVQVAVDFVEDVDNNAAVQIILNALTMLGLQAKVRMSLDAQGNSFWDSEEGD